MEDTGQSIFGNRDLKSGEGWVQELQHLVDIAATQLVGHVKTTAEAAGMPWGSTKITNAEAVKRLEEFEDPSKAEKFAQLSDQAVITAAIDAIRRRKQAISNGELDERPAKLDGVDGTFRPATIQPGFVAGVSGAAPAIATEEPAPNVMPTSLPAQMALPGLAPAGQAPA